MSSPKHSCYHVERNGRRTTVDHCKTTRPGKTFYYCSLHRVLHCVKFCMGIDHDHNRQPRCGECAWVFFSFPDEGQKLPTLDVPISGRQTALARASHFPAEGRRPNARYRRIDGSGSRSVEPSGTGSNAANMALSTPEASLANVNMYADTTGRNDTEARTIDCAPTTLFPQRCYPNPRNAHSRPDYASSVVVEELVNDEGDTVMVDSYDAVKDNHQPSSGYSMVTVPIRDHDSVFSVIPYDNPAVFDVCLLCPHPKFEGLCMFGYTDFMGLPAIQVVEATERYDTYYDTLALEESSHGCDPLMLMARRWSAWSQGYKFLESELRWILTLIFDLANVTIARQREEGYGPEAAVF